MKSRAGKSALAKNQLKDQRKRLTRFPGGRLASAALLIGIALCVLVGTVIWAVGMLRSDTAVTKEEPQLPGVTIAGQKVSAAEFKYALSEVKSQAVAACAGEENSIGADFWHKNQAKCNRLTAAPTASSENERKQLVLQKRIHLSVKSFARAPANRLNMLLAWLCIY